MSRTPTVPKPTPVSRELVKQDRALRRAEARVDEIRDRRATLIRQLRADGWTWPSIADLLGVSRQRVQAIVAEGEG